MITEKRSRRPPEKFEDTERKLPRKERQVEKKLKVSGCNYELIPVPQKYEETATLFLAHANVPWSIKGDDIDSDMSLLNEFHLYRGAYITEYEGQKMVVIKAERRTDRRFIRWRTLVKKLSQGGMRHRHFGNTVQGFCERVEASANDYINKVGSLSVQKGGKAKIAEFKADIDKKKLELMKTLPYLQYRSSLRGFQTELDEIIINEKFLQIMGYTLEDFASTVVSEGLPPLLGMRLGGESETIEQCRHTHNRDSGNNKTATLYYSLHSRSNYVQEAKVYSYILMNHDEKEYKLDFISTVVDHNYPFNLPPIYKGPALTQDYRDFMLEREKQMEKFLKYFDNDFGFIRFSNQHKICKIKEIKPIKNEEEEEDERNSTTASPPDSQIHCKMLESE